MTVFFCFFLVFMLFQTDNYLGYLMIISSKKNNMFFKKEWKIMKFIKTSVISFAIICAVRLITYIFGVVPHINYWPLIALGIAIFCGIVAATRGKVFKVLLIILGVCACIAIVGGIIFLAAMIIGAFCSPNGLTAAIILLIAFGGAGGTILVIICD